MKKFLAVAILAFAGSAQAVPIDDPHDIDSMNPVGYTFFSVLSEGIFDVSATSTNSADFIDPQLRLFAGSVSNSTQVATNDDAYGTYGGGYYDSYINNIFLGLGDYVAATSNFSFSLAEAVSGFTDYTNTGTINIGVTVNGRDNQWENRRAGYTPDATLTVPEPTTLALLGMGLIAGFSVNRKRSANRS